MIKAYFQRFTSVLLVAMAAMSLYSCTEEELPGYDIPYGYYMDAESIEFNVTEWTLEVGDKFTLEATVYPDDVYYTGVTWSSSDESIATVSDSGVVTAVALGEAKIIATSIQTESLTAEVAITVAEEVVTIESLQIVLLSSGEAIDEVDVAINDFVELGVVFTPSNVTNTSVMWVITDFAEIASVGRETGTITGKTEGVCHVEVKSLDDETITAQCEITVKYMDLESFTIYSTESFEADEDDEDAVVPEDVIHTGSRSIGVTQEILLEIDTEPYNATVVSTVWTSSDSNIASIDEDGNVTGQGMGTATITAVCTDMSGNNVSSTFDVIVEEIIADSISLYSMYASARPGESFEADIILNTYPTYAIAADLEWSVEGLSDVTVVENRDLYGGVTATVTAGSQTGSFTLTASYVDDPTITSSITLSVDSATNINIDPEFHDAAFPLTDGSVQLTWTYLNTGSGSGSYNAPSITWSSSDESIATVDANGLVTFGSFAAYSYGDVTISAESSYDGTVETVDISIPGGYFREMFDTDKSFGTANSINYGENYFLFSHGVGQASNTSTSHYADGYITITSNYTTTYASASSPKYPDDSNSNIYYTASRRSDIWCYDESICLLNGNTYPYVAFHIDDIIAQGLGNVKYIELDFNITADAGSTTIAKISSAGSYDGYSDSRITVYYLSDDTQILVFNLQAIGNANLLTNLTSEASSYFEPYSISINYNEYGYDVDQADDDGGISAYAMTAFSFNMYSVQTFASLADIETYISSLGVTEK